MSMGKETSDSFMFIEKDTWKKWGKVAAIVGVGMLGIAAIL